MIVKIQMHDLSHIVEIKIFGQTARFDWCNWPLFTFDGKSINFDEHLQGTVVKC